MVEQAIIQISLMKSFGISIFWDYYECIEISLSLPFIGIQIGFKKKTKDNKWLEFSNELFKF